MANFCGGSGSALATKRPSSHDVPQESSAPWRFQIGGPFSQTSGLVPSDVLMNLTDRPVGLVTPFRSLLGDVTEAELQITPHGYLRRRDTFLIALGNFWLAAWVSNSTCRCSLRTYLQSENRRYLGHAAGGSAAVPWSGLLCDGHQSRSVPINDKESECHRDAKRPGLSCVKSPR